LNALIFSIPIFLILIPGLFFFPITNSAFAEDESEKKRLEEQREQEKKARERLEEQLKKAEEKDKEQQKKFNESLRESLKIEFEDDDLGSGNLADWVLMGTLVLIVGVFASTGYKILKPKKKTIVSKK
jgi:lipid II:glycine glycyltransferase (peptidoglycan interpeptide bridge formation enzyme)